MAQGRRPASPPGAPMETLWADGDGGASERATGEPELVVDVSGYEGPLDLLLQLARTQKVDLTHVSVLALAEQYIAFIERVRALRLEIAADYLVMAAWLAFLKSKLLIPKKAGEKGESGEEMAAVLQFRLRRLEAMREAAARLMNLNRLGRDVFARGAPEAVIVDKRSEYQATLYDLLSAYAAERQHRAVTNVRISVRKVWSLKDARELLTRLIGAFDDWTSLDSYLIDYMTTPEQRSTALASSFAASLEMVREGQIEIRQDGAFQPIYMRNSGRAAKTAGAR